MFCSIVLSISTLVDAGQRGWDRETGGGGVDQRDGIERQRGEGGPKGWDRETEGRGWTKGMG